MNYKIITLCDTELFTKLKQQIGVENVLLFHFQIPTEWEIPDGKVHLGVKIAYELYPKLLKDRITKERKEAFWDTQSREAIAKASKTVEDFDAAHSNPNQVKVVTYHIFFCLTSNDTKFYSLKVFKGEIL